MTHEVVAAPGPNGRPGVRMLSFSRPFFEPRMMPDDSRDLGRVMIGHLGSTFGVVCMTPVSPRPPSNTDPLEARVSRLLRLRDRDPISARLVISRIGERTIGGERALGVRTDLPGGQSVFDWHLQHGGWNFAAGPLRFPGDDLDEILARTDRTLATWRWIEPESSPQLEGC